MAVSMLPAGREDATHVIAKHTKWRHPKNIMASDGTGTAAEQSSSP
jgi:hypothetical protein